MGQDKKRDEAKFKKTHKQALKKRELKDVKGGSCYLDHSTVVPVHDMGVAECDLRGGRTSEW